MNGIENNNNVYNIKMALCHFGIEGVQVYLLLKTSVDVNEFRNSLSRPISGVS